MHYFKERIGKMLNKFNKPSQQYFKKYDLKGAYHWDFYYNKTQPYYVNVVNTVKELVTRGSEVLDLGCGDGLISNVLAEELNCKVVGIDNNPTAIKLARELNKNENCFYEMSVEDISFEEYFDYVLVVDLIEHLKHPKLLLEKAYRSLKSNGKLIISTPLFEQGKKIDPYHVKEFSREELIKLLAPLFLLKQETKITYHEINFITLWIKKD